MNKPQLDLSQYDLSEIVAALAKKLVKEAAEQNTLRFADFPEDYELAPALAEARDSAANYWEEIGFAHDVAESIYMYQGEV